MGVSTGVGWGGIQGEVRLIHIGTYNIRNGQNGGLEPALRRMSQANMDLRVFHKTKLTKSIYTRESSGYKVVATESPSAHSNGISIFYMAEEHFSV